MYFFLQNKNNPTSFELNVKFNSGKLKIECTVWRVKLEGYSTKLLSKIRDSFTVGGIVNANKRPDCNSAQIKSYCGGIFLFSRKQFERIKLPNWNFIVDALPRRGIRIDDMSYLNIRVSARKTWGGKNLEERKKERKERKKRIVYSSVHLQDV